MSSSAGSNDAFSSPERAAKKRKHGVGKSEKVQVASTSDVTTVDSSNMECVGGTVLPIVQFYDVILVSKTKKTTRRPKREGALRNLCYDYAIFPDNLQTLYTIEAPIIYRGLGLITLEKLKSSFTTFQREQFLIMEVVCKYIFDDNTTKATFKGFKEYCEKEELMDVYAILEKDPSACALSWSRYMIMITMGFNDNMKNSVCRSAIEQMLAVARIIGINERPVIAYNLGGSSANWINNTVLHYNTSTGDLNPKQDTGLEALNNKLLQFPTLPVSNEELLEKGFEVLMYVPGGYLATCDEAEDKIIFIAEANKGSEYPQGIFDQTWIQALRGLSDREGAEASNTVYGFSMSANQGTLMRIRRINTIDDNNTIVTRIVTHYDHYYFQKTTGKAGEGGKIMKENFLKLQYDILKIIQMEASLTLAEINS